MKKILLYIDCMQMGGANRVMANLANHFSDLEKDVVLINDVYAAEGVHPDIHVVYLHGSKLIHIQRRFRGPPFD